MIVIYDDKSGYGQARISHTLVLRGGQVLGWQRQPSPFDPQRMTIRFGSNSSPSLPAKDLPPLATKCVRNAG